MMISGIKTRDLIDKADLKGGKDAKALKLASSSKYTRQALLKHKTEESRIAAAIEIQRVYRGYCTRCRLLNSLDPKISQTAVFSKSNHDRLVDVRTPSPVKQAPKSAKSIEKTESSHSRISGRERLENYYQSYVNRMFNAGHRANSPSIITFEEFCANYIQNWWSQTQKRRKSTLGSFTSGDTTGGSSSSVPKHKEKKPAPKKKKRTVPLQNNEAAAIIQRAWRKHIDVQVYKYYRDLINFKQRGDPMMMLKCINPQEAKMLDAASGIHIKFRLAGDRFPPNIYYKIYTHRPIQDLCANSPKDYTQPDAKRKMARDVHNKGNRVPVLSKIGWYQRMENNGWRLVSDRLIHHIYSDPVTWETSRKKVEFHHNKFQRKVDVEKKKKKKKIDWMQKMYKQGMLKAKVDDKETVDLIEGAAAGMVATIDSHGPEAIQDWEVDELLDWTTSLNFEDYVTGWKEIATSSKSEKSSDERAGLFSTTVDPFEFSIGSKKDYDASTRPSHNTPVSSRSAGSLRQPLAY